MPLADFTTRSMDMEMEIGVPRHWDDDEMYLKNLSVYATLRPGNLQPDLGRKDLAHSHRPIADILDGWKKDRLEETIDESESVKADTTPVQLELRDHELQVKGFEVDSGIVPGYRYHVRYIGTNDYLFNGEARRLESIGIGYGRRLTFKGDTLNFNDCYFWSDSSEEGFAFSLEAVREGDEFAIMNTERQPIGTVSVQSADFPQEELASEVNGSSVVKTVKVRLSCFVKHNPVSHHSLININPVDYEEVEGIAQVVKVRGSKEAVVRCIQGVYFQALGSCSLHRDP